MGIHLLFTEHDKKMIMLIYFAFVFKFRYISSKISVIIK